MTCIYITLKYQINPTSIFLDTALGISAIFCVYGRHFEIQDGDLISNFYFLTKNAHICSYKCIDTN